ncbi:hypothetical protein [Silvibacterium acidisoli]|uniref:hypothetical protein n=1 Tax=Acidobacteriaceae bacterium ZG23-2 TaxID=2883246 RepID=UPI00406C132E
MLKKPAVNEILVQPYYMSGDRNTIASALQVKKDLGVLVMTPPGSPELGDEMRRFYVSITSQSRVEVLDVPANLSNNRAHSPDGEAVLRDAYKQITNHIYNSGRNPRPQWLGRAVAQDVKLKSATFGTQVIADKFSTKPRVGGIGAEKARAQLQSYWRLDGAHRDLPGLEDRVGQWLVEKKKLHFNKRYVFLFAKEGDRRAEKAHHFTSIGTWKMLIDKLAGYGRTSPHEVPVDVIPVAVGDRIGLKTEPDLSGFWEEPDWKDLFTKTATGDENDPILIDGRRAQLGLWCYLAMRHGGVSIIGMRSGMIEVPALVGIRTLYLEEEWNSQAQRMEKWIGKVPGFERQKVQRPPGIKQQIYWKEKDGQFAKDDALRHIRSNTQHLNGMVMNARPNPTNQVLTPPAESMQSQGDFDRYIRSNQNHPRIQMLNEVRGKSMADGFGLQPTEWTSILNWIRNTPAPIAQVTNDNSGQRAGDASGSTS